MKTRQSFVTNSSSSSFICVLGEVIDKEKFEAAKLGECYFGWQFKALIKDWETPFDSLGAEWAGVYINEEDLDDDKEYFYWEKYGGAGSHDSHFAVLDDAGDYDYLDYDVDLDDFPEDQQAMYTCITPENGLIDILRGYGAGRNG